MINIVTYRNQCFLHTSWPFWDGNFHPKRSSRAALLLWKLFVNKLSGVFAVTDSVKIGFLAKYPSYPEYKVNVVNHAIDDEFYQKSQSLHIDNKKRLSIIFVGRFDLSKGVDLIVDSAHQFPSIDFNLVGEGGFPLEQIPTNLTVHGKVSCRKKLASLMSQSDVLLLPSRRQNDWQELFGMVIIEGFSAGLYPIVTNHIGPKEIIDNSCGSLIQEESMRSDIFSELNNQLILFEGNKMLSKSFIKKYAKKYTAELISEKWKRVMQ